MNDITLLECFVHPSFHLEEIIKNFLSLNFAGGDFSSHLWYINSYLHLAVAFPLLKLLTLDTPLSRKVCKWLIFIGVADMFVTDIQAMLPSNSITVGSFRLFGSLPFALVLIGHIIYKNQNLFVHSRKYRLWFVIGMAGISAIRFGITCMFFNLGMENNYHNYWNSCFSLFFSVCFTGFFLTFSRTKEESWVKFVNYVGTKTYVIYLIHVAVYTFGDYHGIRTLLYSFTIGIRNNSFSKLCYDIGYPMTVFICCFAITMCLDLIKVPFSFIRFYHKRDREEEISR